MQKKLLDHALLTSKELGWLDDYHKMVSGAAAHLRARELVDCLRSCSSTRRFAALHPLNRNQSFSIPGLDKTEQVGGGRRGACMAEGSHSSGDKAAIDTRNLLVHCLLLRT